MTPRVNNRTSISLTAHAYDRLGKWARGVGQAVGNSPILLTNETGFPGDLNGLRCSERVIRVETLMWLWGRR
jgi:hypothetical protein